MIATSIINDNGLFVDPSTTPPTLYGYLFDCGDKGIFAPTGKVDVTPEQAKEHNKLLSQAEIQGLDDNCQVGQGGTFYHTSGNGIRTWNEDVVAGPQDVIIKNKTITFVRKGKTFKGRIVSDGDYFHFKRIS